LSNFNDDDGLDSLYPKYAGGRPPTFTLPQRQQINKIALSRPGDHGLPFSTWSLSKLAEFLVGHEFRPVAAGPDTLRVAPVTAACKPNLPLVPTLPGWPRASLALGSTAQRRGPPTERSWCKSVRPAS
jgi:hypothetical protein